MKNEMSQSQFTYLIYILTVGLMCLFLGLPKIIEKFQIGWFYYFLFASGLVLIIFSIPLSKLLMKTPKNKK